MFSKQPVRPHQTPASSVLESSGDTIAAIATGQGRGGIGIVRISGPQALAIGKRLFRPVKKKLTEPNAAPHGYLPHHLHYGHLVDPHDKSMIDEVLFAFMPAPNSYTREDIVEFQCHGGPAVLKKVLQLVLQSGSRLSEPGEFTRRAFLNGRIDLSQGEAVADIICADSESALKLAARQLGGSLKRRIDDLVEALNDLSADVEALIEFPDELDHAPEYERLHQTLMVKIIQPIEYLLDSYQEGSRMRYGLRIVIAGRPNVGKSSLLNRLIEADKAIVTAVPGTTRDPVEATAPIKGITMSFVDTAGIHASDDPVETIGIRKSIEASADADLVLLLIDATDLGNREDDAVFKSIFKEDILLVVNKIDLVPEAAVLGLPDRIGHLPAAFISALDGTGLTELKERIYEMCVQGARVRPQEDPIIADVRHKLCLEEALADLRNADAGFLEQTPLDLICIDLHHATRALLGTTGERIETKILDRIFERFCIGK